MLSLAQNRVGEDRVAQDPSDCLPSPPAEICPILALSQARTKADLQLFGTCSGKVTVLGCRVWTSHTRCSALIRLGSWRSIKLFFHPDVLIKGRLKVSRQLYLPQSQPPSSNWSVMASAAQWLLSWCTQPSQDHASSAGWTVPRRADLFWE